MDAPSMEQIPVATKESNPIFLDSRLDVSDKVMGL